jgi:hypothetical protein
VSVVSVVVRVVWYIGYPDLLNFTDNMSLSRLACSVNAEDIENNHNFFVQVAKTGRITAPRP